MKKQSNPQSAFFNSRIAIRLACYLTGILLMLLAYALYGGATAQAQRPGADQQNLGRPDVIPMVGPISQDQDLRSLPYIAPNEEDEEVPLMRYTTRFSQGTPDPMQRAREIAAPTVMPTPIATFDGMNSAQSGCGCLPPDTHGDVGPSHYILSANSSIKIFDKTGTPLNGANGTTFNSFFSAMATTPCGLNQNRGDGIVFYDHLAGRWVVSDFAFPAFPGVLFYQCVGVSKTSDPVAGGWWLYAIQVDPSNPNYLGDYPKFGLWPDAYYFSVNMFSNNTTFTGVRVFALDRAAMINGTGAPNPAAVAFSITPATLGDTYSLVPATFRTGLAPPAATVTNGEYFLSIDSPAASGVTLTQVHAWRFHVDFVTPANSTFGLGATHTPNANIAVNGFVDAFTTTTNLVPQNGTASLLSTLGDRLMTPLVYQNLAGTESLWVSHSVNNNQGGTGPVAVRWYQFNVTGGGIPANAAQQQTFNNGADGLWRWMPSLSVDAQGSMAIGYSTSSSTIEPSIRYAGRLIGDPPNTLAQGEAIMMPGGGHQTSTSGRWGDYSGMAIDPADNLTFWHSNEYYSATSSASWNTRIGRFKFGPSAPTPTPTATASPTPTATVTPTPTGTATVTPTATATPPSPTPTATGTPPPPTPTATATPPPPTPTATTTPPPPTPTATATPPPPTPTATATPPPPTPTATATPPPPTPTATATPLPPTPTATATPPPPTPTPTPTPPPPTPTPTATPSPSPTPATQPLNISTRMRVQTGDNVGIGGFIITGNAPKRVLVRAMGPSITSVPNPLADPVLELHGQGIATVTNNNWKDDPVQQALIESTGLAPSNNLESAIHVTLAPGTYTAVVRGNNNATGIGLIEVYDLNPTVPAKLANISTRALVGTGNDIVIAGFILGNNSNPTRLVLRGIGPSLAAFPAPNALADPTLEVRNSSGTVVASNNDWQSDPAQAAELTAAGLAPSNSKESGIALTLGPGPYTALLSGVGGTTGVGVVEVFDRGAAPAP